MPSDAVTALQRSLLFKDLPIVHLERLAKRAGRRKYEAGEAVFHEGEPGNALFIVDSGELQIRAQAPARTELILARMRPGDAFGELALLDDEPRSASAIAVVDSRLLLVHRDDFLALLAAEPDVVQSVLRSLARIIRRTNQKLGDLALGDVHRRMARALLDLADSYGRPHPNGLEIARTVTAVELGQATAMHRVEVERLLREYEYERLIDVENDHIVLRRPETLQSWL